MKMSKLSNQTNSQDPQAVNSRVFVGNLNTFQCSKTDVERMFQKYGRLAGISMHKGYAFVQFTNPFDARNACHGEDGKTILSQTLDVNMVAEPKAHQVGRKRQNVTKTGNDWDYFYDSYYSSTLFRSTRPIKRKRLMTNQQQSRILADSVKQNQINAAVAAAAAAGLASHQHQNVALNGISNIQTLHTQLYPQQQNTNGISVCNGSPSHNPIAQYLHPALPTYNCNVENNISCAALQWGPFKIYSNPDTLICGNCRECFTELSELLDHKKVYCKLRFTCKCQDSSQSTTKNQMPKAKLLCAVCKETFTNPWDLMVHAREAHTVNIYELGSDLSTTSNNKEDRTNDEENSSDGDHFCVIENSLKDDTNVRDDLSVDGRLSQSSNSNILTDEISKLNGTGSLSSRGSSPVSGNEEARECILHALSIQNQRSIQSSPIQSSIELMSTGIFHAPEPITLQ